MVYFRWFYRNYRRLVVVAIGVIVLMVCWVTITRQDHHFRRLIQSDGQGFFQHRHDHTWRKITVVLPPSTGENQSKWPEPTYSLPVPEDPELDLEMANDSTSSRPTTDSKILLVHKESRSQQPKMLKVFLQSQEIPYDTYVVPSPRTPSLTRTRAGSTDLIGRYKIIIVLGFYIDRTLWSEIKRYCTMYGAHLISITSSSDVFLEAGLGDSSLNPHLRTSQIHLQVDRVRFLRTTNCNVLTVTRADMEWKNVPDDWVTSFSPDTAWYSSRGCPSSVKLHGRMIQWVDLAEVVLRNSIPQTVSSALIDCGSTDGVMKAFIGLPLSFSLTKLLLIDVIHYFSDGLPILRFLTKRWLQIDVDDVFVAPSGLKMTEKDVEAMLEAQKAFQEYVPGFQFNLGYCGKYFRKGSAKEADGDLAFVKHADNFRWFGHTFGHSQPHLISTNALRKEMVLNKKFAEGHGLPIQNSSYSVSPHHSGIYPIIPSLYSVWKEVWNVSVTSTEEYPHIHPDYLRKGFVYNGVKVLPRQTCRLFTKIYNYTHFSGGKDELLSLAEGGEVFHSLLDNPVAIFMTHTINYAMDRLALVLFEALLRFTFHFTNLQLLAATPLQLAEEYFRIFPEHQSPLWTNPCKDNHHLEIWPTNKSCSRLPSFIILGPQKTGSTALHAFLKLHPQLVSNNDTAHGFEEIQFFSNNELYQKGLDWYMDCFPILSNPQSQHLFEKSATYFTSPLSPRRIHSLLPNTKLVIILAEPVKRAYSWYQHSRAHDDPSSKQYEFEDVLNSTLVLQKNPSSPVSLLRKHCLLPGRYYEHIHRWLKYFNPKQLYFIDGEMLVQNPVMVMERLTKFLGLPSVDYNQLLKYNSKKGFFCSVKQQNRMKCLGSSKGRRYPEMSDEAHHYLTQYYAEPNKRLAELLSELSSISLPTWLVEEPTNTNTTLQYQ